MLKQRREPQDEDLVRLYLADVGKHALLTKDQEVELAQLIEAGTAASAELEQEPAVSPARRRQLRRAIAAGDAASLRFVNSNLRLVVSIAKKYQSSGLPLLDIVQEGNLGLIHAVDKFDWRKGFKFSTYATWWIRQAIQRGIANSARVIRLPVHAGDMLTALLKMRAQLEGSLGRTPTLAELAAERSSRSTRSSKCCATQSTRSRSTSPSVTTVTPSSATSSRTATRPPRSTRRRYRCCRARWPRC